MSLAITRRQCVSATQPTGTVILSGLHEEVSEMPATDIIRREIVVAAPLLTARPTLPRRCAC